MTSSLISWLYPNQATSSLAPCPLTSVKIRAATADEQRVYNAGRTWAFFPSLWTIWAKISNTAQILWSQNPEQVFANSINRKDVFSICPTLGTDWLLTEDLKIMKAIQQFARSDASTEGLYEIPDGQMMLQRVLQEMFQIEVNKEDFLLTCSKPKVKTYREFLATFLHKMSEHRAQIREITEIQLSKWPEQQKINFTFEAQKLSVTVISQVFLGFNEVNDAFVEVIKTINEYVSSRAIGLPIPTKQKEEFDIAAQNFRKIIEKILKESSSPFINDLKKQNFNSAQTSGLIYMMFLGGEETTAALLTFLIWQLALNQSEQQKIYLELKDKKLGADNKKYDIHKRLHNAFLEAIRLFTPAYIIGRKPRKDLIIDMKDTKGQISQKYIPNHQGIMACPMSAARNPAKFENPNEFKPDRHKQQAAYHEWTAFGSGFHACLGQALAQEEIEIFTGHLIQNFKIESSCIEIVKRQGFMTLKLAKPIYITVTKRDV